MKTQKDIKTLLKVNIMECKTKTFTLKTIAVTVLFIIGLLPSCTVNKQLLVTGGSKADGTITMHYEVGAFEKPLVDWDKAQHDAIQRCRVWGYNGAKFFDAGTVDCVDYNQYGCIRWRVTYTCQCTD